MPRIENPLLYPDCFKVYVTESGRVRTAATEDSFKIQMRALQNVHPGKGVRNFTAQDLTAYCVSNNAAPKTQMTRRSLFQSFFEWATYMGLVKENPALHLKYTVHPKNQSVRRHTWLSTPDFLRLLSEMPRVTEVERRDRMLVFVGALTGLRSSNLATLRWSMFTPGLASIRVVTKGQKLKEFGVPDVLVSELETWRSELRPRQGQDGPVFPRFHYQLTADGTAWEMVCNWNVGVGAQGVGTAVAKAGELIFPGVQKLCPHDLRRSYAGYLEDQGFDVKDISRALGHENMSTTSVYMDRNPNRTVAVGRGLRVNLS